MAARDHRLAVHGGGEHLLGRAVAHALLVPPGLQRGEVHFVLLQRGPSRGRRALARPEPLRLLPAQRAVDRQLGRALVALLFLLPLSREQWLVHSFTQHPVLSITQHRFHFYLILL